MRWTQEKIGQLREIARTGATAAEAGASMGATAPSVITAAARYGIAIVKYSPEQQRIYDERAVAREAVRKARNVAARKAKRIQARKDLMAAQAAREPAPKAAKVAANPAKPFARSVFQDQYRNMPAPTKAEQYADLAQAVRNTAAMALDQRGGLV